MSAALRALAGELAARARGDKAADDDAVQGGSAETTNADVRQPSGGSSSEECEAREKEDEEEQEAELGVGETDDLDVATFLLNVAEAAGPDRAPDTGKRPRHRGGRTRGAQATVDDIRACQHLPLRVAAKRVGLGTTQVRESPAARFGRSRWRAARTRLHARTRKAPCASCARPPAFARIRARARLGCCACRQRAHGLRAVTAPGVPEADALLKRLSHTRPVQVAVPQAGHHALAVPQAEGVRTAVAPLAAGCVAYARREKWVVPCHFRTPFD